jgi:hypothetical protein
MFSTNLLRGMTAMIILLGLTTQCAIALLASKYVSRAIVSIIDLKDPMKTKKETIVADPTKQLADPRAQKLLAPKRSVAQ